MEKIVIVSSQPYKDNPLIALLNTLFPDCEIHVTSSRIEALEEVLIVAEELGDKVRSYWIKA